MLMKKTSLALAFCCFTFLSFAQQVPYTSGNNGWKEDSLGNHRAVIVFNGDGNVANVVVPWRRNDVSPEKKRIIVQDAKTGAKYPKCKNRHYRQ
jgi:hypothetical protein